MKRVKKRDLEDIVLESIKDEQQVEDITFKKRFSVWVERQKDCGVSDNPCKYIDILTMKKYFTFQVQRMAKKEQFP